LGNLEIGELSELCVVETAQTGWRCGEGAVFPIGRTAQDLYRK